MAERELAPVPEPTPVLPDTIVITGTGADFRLSPNEIRQLKAVTGQTLTQLLAEDADEADRLQAMVWLRLRRLGFTDARWEDAGDIAVEYEEPVPDPTSGEPSNSSPDSVATGE